MKVAIMTEAQIDAYELLDKAVTALAGSFEVNEDGLQYAVYQTVADAINDLTD